MKHYNFEIAAICLAGFSAAREFLEPIFFERDRELLVVALCDDGVRLMQLLGFPGSEDAVQLPIANVMRQALSIEASGIILAHNHPSGEQRPSKSDLQLTRRVCLAAEAIDLTVLDHLIFAHGPVFSFRQTGLL